MAHNELALLQQRIAAHRGTRIERGKVRTSNAYATEAQRATTSEETTIAASDRERRILKRSKLPARPRLEPAYKMAPIKKPKGFKRAFKSLVERTNEAAANERGKK